ncbi:sugar ABC transporter permease, partial [Priestia sp. SIMBA_032]|uniref:carbohydrate ABC transporter permease n=1 Tax=Priestia sp. SIMBA_032 TaxID=3085775 RepID=UPI00397E6454
TGLLFLAPFGLLFIFVFIIPILYSAYISLFQNKLIGGQSFVGLDNYVRLFKDPQFYDGAIRVVVFTAIQVPIMLALSLFFALALDSGRVRGSVALRLL